MLQQQKQSDISSYSTECLAYVFMLERPQKHVTYLTEPFLQVFSNDDDPRRVTVILQIKHNTRDGWLGGIVPLCNAGIN